MISKIRRIYRHEGVGGIAKKVSQMAYLVKVAALTPRSTKAVRSRYGVMLAPNFKDATFRACCAGGYGRFYWEHVAQRREEFIYLDIGANQGLYSLCASKNENCVAVYAFEPVQKTFDLLSRNVALNGADAKCRLVRKAVSNEAGTARITTTSGHSGTASMAQASKDGDDVAVEEIESIDGQGLNEAVADSGSARLVVKIDVEGFEKLVILGLIDSGLMPRVDEIFYEVDERWVDPAELQSLLQNSGFTEFSKVGSNPTHYDVLTTKP